MGRNFIFAPAWRQMDFVSMLDVLESDGFFEKGPFALAFPETGQFGDMVGMMAERMRCVSMHRYPTHVSRRSDFKALVQFLVEEFGIGEEGPGVFVVDEPEMLVKTAGKFLARLGSGRFIPTPYPKAGQALVVRPPYGRNIAIAG